MDGIVKSEAARRKFPDMTIFYAEDGGSTHLSAAFRLPNNV